MESGNTNKAKERALLTRLDRIACWPYPRAVLWVIGTVYLIAFFDITKVAFALPVFNKALHFSEAQAAWPITTSLIGYVVGA